MLQKDGKAAMFAADNEEVPGACAAATSLIEQPAVSA